MHITFLGAVREVTGSMHMITTQNDHILLDCGMFQGRRKEAAEKNKVMPFDPSIITNIVLSHAHIDHSGRLPLLTRKDFQGRIFCTRATHDTCRYLLPDSAKIQESDAKYLNYKIVKRALAEMQGRDGKIQGRDAREIKGLLKENNSHRINDSAISDFIRKYGLEHIEPIYSMQDADIALSMFEGLPYKEEVTIGKGITCKLYEAGHILGSAVSIIKVKSEGTTRTICYTGDIGRFDKPILRNPTLEFEEEDRDIDLLVMESTYGDRDHESINDLKPRLRDVLNRTISGGGSVIIPSFAFGRTQELLYYIHELYNEGSVPKVPVWVDSPLATNITKVFGEHPEMYDRETHHTFLQNGLNPFHFKEVNFTTSVEDSIAITRDTRSHIVISASGMCEAGRILHHLRYKIHNPKNTILIVGYMAQNTLGRRIEEEGGRFEEGGRKGDPPMMRFYGKDYPLLARVEKIGGFSAHADRHEMLRFLKSSNLNIKKIALVHGEEDQALSFQDFLGKEGYSVVVPKFGEVYDI
ncbi:MBL fold metallo-hydrolase RNA specificity domain-containing protein [Desulfopila inferna]|uniref:MBL fold metallo-hydrolase RNA specificity domain-containing protein n=1 Tax=Desulfopila inferna TaxID=468528 RepID=UPI0019664F1A|nr:MBL fold metallo-hydrolase [Desulfopila inferna]MBM9603256.1 MBL fold metallo-hydrolase [Desulfopila inferna]